MCFLELIVVFIEIEIETLPNHDDGEANSVLEFTSGRNLYIHIFKEAIFIYVFFVLDFDLEIITEQPSELMLDISSEAFDGTHKSSDDYLELKEITIEPYSDSKHTIKKFPPSKSLPNNKQRLRRNSTDPPSPFTLLLLRNLRTKDGIQLTCDICSRTFVSRSKLLLHMSSHYGSHLKCKQCPATFASYNERRAHSKTHPRKKLCCDICGAQHLDRRNLDVHIRTHTGEKPYKCELCPRAFNESYKLKIHLQRHNNILPYNCELCPKRFATAWQVKTHQRTHIGRKAFACDVCGKSFVTQQAVELHGRVHTGEKPYECPHPRCDRKFAWAHSLKKHMHVHDEEATNKVLQFGCTLCDTTCSSMDMLWLHNQSAHHDGSSSLVG